MTDQGLWRAHYSVLFENSQDRLLNERARAPEFFPDLNCDQIIDAVVAGKDEYNLKPFFYGRLRRVGAIKYRHEVMQDLEGSALFAQIRAFAEKMGGVREQLARVQRLHYKEQQQAWFLSAVELYCESVTSFLSDLSASAIKSRGLSGFRDYLAQYTRSTYFATLVSSMNELKAQLAAVKYCVLINGGSVTVRKYEAENNCSIEIEQTFAKFKQGSARDYKVIFHDTDDMADVEARILERVAKLHPELFLSLENFYIKNEHFIDDAVTTFDREIQFYIAYLSYVAPLKQAGLRFCYPRVSDTDKECSNSAGFDVALAHKLIKENRNVVPNDFSLSGPERVLVVSGPNQGGKTTFARTFGQLHYLASIGCPVPGTQAKTFLFDRLFTHFEREEKIQNLRGKLEDDLMRIHEILNHATPQSILIMNEIFTSTTIQDEIFLSKKIMEKLKELDILCVWVTFVDELTSCGRQTVSMMSTVAPENPALRTFKIVRRPADGLAYAMAIAQKHRLTYDSIKERMTR